MVARLSVYFNGKEELDESPDSGAGLPNSLPSPAVSGHQLPLSSTPIVSSYILRQAWVHRAEREGMWVRTASSQLPECQDCAVDAGLPSAILRIRQLMDGNGGFSTSEKSTHGSCRLCDVLIAISSSSSTSTDAAALSSYINHYKPSIASGCALIPSPHACSSFPCSLLSHLSSCASYSPTHPSRANTAFGKCQAAAAVLARSASAAGLLSSPPAPLSGPARTLTAAAVKRIMISSGYSSPAAALLLAHLSPHVWSELLPVIEAHLCVMVGTGLSMGHCIAIAAVMNHTAVNIGTGLDCVRLHSSLSALFPSTSPQRLFPIFLSSSLSHSASLSRCSSPTRCLPLLSSACLLLCMTSHTPSPHQSQSVTSEARVSVSGSSGVLGTVIASDEAVPSVALPSLPLLRLLWFVCASELSADVCAPLFDVFWARDPSQWLSAHKSNGFRLLTCLSSLIDLLLPSDGGVPSLYCMSLLSEGKAEVERRCWVILCATALQAAAVACRAVEGPDQVAAFASAVFQKLIPMLPHLPVGEFKDMPLSTPAVIDLDMDDVDGDIERAAWSLLYGSMPSVHLRSTTCDRHTVNVDRLTTHLESLSWADPLPIVCSLLLSSPVPSLFSSLCALVQSSPTVCVPPSLPFLCALAARVCPRPACVCALPCSSPLTHNVCDPDLTPLLNTVYEQLSSVLTSGGVDALAGVLSSCPFPNPLCSLWALARVCSSSPLPSLSLVSLSCVALEIAPPPPEVLAWFSHWPPADVESHIASVVATLHACWNTLSSEPNPAVKKLTSNLLRYLGGMCYNPSGLSGMLLARCSLGARCASDGCADKSLPRVPALVPVITILEKGEDVTLTKHALLVFDIIAEEMKNVSTVTNAFASLCERSGVLTSIIGCMFLDSPTMLPHHRLAIGRTALSIIRNSLQAAMDHGIVQLRELLLSPSCGLLLGLNGLWKCASQQSGAQDTLADVIDVLRLACADGPSGGFAAQIVGMQDSLAGIMKAVMSLTPEHLSSPSFSETGLLGQFCAAASTVPRLKSILDSVALPRWLYRIGAIPNYDTSSAGRW